MADETSSSRSVKIDADERGGWSSDRPRRDGAPPRPASLTVRCRVLSPSDNVRYSPGSLLVLVSADKQARDDFADRLIDDRSSLLSLDKVRGLLAGRVPEDAVEAKAAELLDAAAAKRFQAGESVVIAADGLSDDERMRYVRLANAAKRPSHVILIEGGDDPELKKLRKRLEAGELGEEGFNTAMRLGGSSLSELKRIVFRPEPRDD